VAAPIKAEQVRRREALEFRESMLALLKDHIEHVLSLSRYVHGDDLDEAEATKDIVELSMLYNATAFERFGIDENDKFKATPEQLRGINREVARRINLRFFNHGETVEQYDKTEEQWNQARANMEAGVDSAESEAAEYLRQLMKRYPRRRDAKRFYDMWE
jgi:outer membrane protein TolC